MKSKDMIPVILAVGGSDPTGGAGIQADLKTLTVLGVYAAAAITCVTVQNSRGLSRSVPLEPDLVAGQVRAVLDDHRVTHLKVGMVGTGAIARCLAGVLADFPGQVIVDPVLTASTGQDLTGEDGLQEMQASLLKRATVLTPNLDELARFTNSRSREDLSWRIDAARSLLTRYPRLACVAVKGGHAPSDSDKIVDLCVFRDRIVQRAHTRICTDNSHGTGCTFASAIAAFHAKTGDYEESFKKSSMLLHRLLTLSAAHVVTRQPARGGGPLLHTLARQR